MDISVSNVGAAIKHAPTTAPTAAKIEHHTAVTDADKAAHVVDGNNATVGSEPTQKLSDKKIEDTLANINNFFKLSDRSMQFSLSEGTGKTVVEIKDGKTGEVIRQIPTEEALNLEKKLDEVQGLLFSKKA